MESFEQVKRTIPEEQLAEIKKRYQLEITAEEKDKFNEWRNSANLGSIESPIKIESVEDVLTQLPNAPNYSGERIELFFTKDNLSIEFLGDVLGNFRSYDYSFEIGIHRYTPDTFSVEVGSKMGGTSPRSDAAYIGHYHPRISLENIDAPPAFTKGLVPSSGDIKGFFSHIAAVSGGTIIVSPHGHTEVHFVENSHFISDEKVQSFKGKYFGLFLGRNELGWQTDEDVKKFYRNEFGLELDFKYNK